MYLSLILALFCLMCRCCQASIRFACRDVWFGRPLEEDAFDAIKQFPDYGKKTDKRMRQRLFVQPQYLDPPFSPVVNTKEQPIVQLPKIWRSGNARFALLPVKLAYNEKVQATSSSAWPFVEACALRLSATCIQKEARSGFCLIGEPEYEDIGGMVLYLYASGSAFEVRLTEEMINGGGIMPREFTNGVGDEWRFANDTMETLEDIT